MNRRASSPRSLFFASCFVRNSLSSSSGIATLLFLFLAISSPPTRPTGLCPIKHVDGHAFPSSISCFQSGQHSAQQKSGASSGTSA